ncbi:hypothetical protein QE250_00330 [Chromatiaceae bacterium AAb-1]|nr:hypothetical protein [Chromatiaceae bacterium AAb-1]
MSRQKQAGSIKQDPSKNKHYKETNDFCGKKWAALAAACRIKPATTGLWSFLILICSIRTGLIRKKYWAGKSSDGMVSVLKFRRKH